VAGAAQEVAAASVSVDPFKPAIDAMLRADLDAPRKQRHTAKRIFDRLVAEQEMEGLSYATVSDYVGWRRPDIRHEAGREPAQVFIAQTHRPGRDAEVDFGEAHALDVLGGVPTGKVRYDNLTSAVRQVLGFKRARVETSAGWRFARTMGLMRSTARPGWKGRMRKVGSRARSAASAATIWCRCPSLRRWLSSTR
jgi:hypothetical protein